MANQYVSRAEMLQLVSLETGDITVVCSDSVFHVHKKHLIGLGGFFRVALDERYGFQELVTLKIDLSEDNGEIFKYLAFFAYTGCLLSYSNTAQNVQLDKELVSNLQVPNDTKALKKGQQDSAALDQALKSILLLSKVYYMADKYCITALERLCASEVLRLAQVLAKKPLQWLPIGSANLEALYYWIEEVYARTRRYDLYLKESICVLTYQVLDRATKLGHMHIRFFLDMVLCGNLDLRNSVDERAQPAPPACPGCHSSAGCAHLGFLNRGHTGYCCECQRCGLRHEHPLAGEDMDWEPGQWPVHERCRMLCDEVITGVWDWEEVDRLERQLGHVSCV